MTSKITNHDTELEVLPGVSQPKGILTQAQVPAFMSRGWLSGGLLRLHIHCSPLLVASATAGMCHQGFLV